MLTRGKIPDFPAAVPIPKPNFLQPLEESSIPYLLSIDGQSSPTHCPLTFSLCQERGQKQGKQCVWDPQQHGELPTAWIPQRGLVFRVSPAKGQPVHTLPASCASQPASPDCSPVPSEAVSLYCLGHPGWEAAKFFLQSILS